MIRTLFCQAAILATLMPPALAADPETKAKVADAFAFMKSMHGELGTLYAPAAQLQWASVKCGKYEDVRRIEDLVLTLAAIAQKDRQQVYLDLHKAQEECCQLAPGHWAPGLCSTTELAQTTRIYVARQQALVNWVQKALAEISAEE